MADKNQPIFNPSCCQYFLQGICGFCCATHGKTDGKICSK